MATDNTTLPAGSGGDTIRTIARSTVKTQVVALDVGGEAGPESLVTSGNALPVSVGNFPATQPVSGTVTTTPPANASTNITQFGGTNVSTGTGTGGAGIPRVTVSSDSFPATQAVSGTVTSNQGGAPWTVKPDGVSWTQTGTSANVNITNASLAVTGAFFQATQPVSGSVSVTNLPISGSGNLLVDATLAGVDVGPALAENALPVVLALDQDVPVRPTGAQPSAQSIAVVLASDQPALPIVFPATTLAPNAAQETGGNLASIAVSGQTLSELVYIQRLMLAELRAMNLQLASMTGISIDPAIGDEQVTFQ